MMFEGIFSQLISLSPEQVIRFYESLIVNLTVVNRAILYDDRPANAVKIKRVKIVNEAIHRIINRVVDKRYSHGIWSEAEWKQKISGRITP